MSSKKLAYIICVHCKRERHTFNFERNINLYGNGKQL